MKKFLIVLFALWCPTLSAQDLPGETNSDSVGLIKEGDTVVIESYAKRFSPRKALLYSAVFPGLGQAYNKKYWKIPIAYGGGFGIYLVLDYYQKQYKDYKSQLFEILEKQTLRSLNGEGYTEEQLRPAINKARRQRDFWVIMMGAMYILQIIDAHVDAHLKEFDVNPNLQVRFQPFLEDNALVGSQKGVSLSIRF